MLQKISMNFLFIKETWKNLTQLFSTANQNIWIISERSCDRSNDAENSAFKSQE